MTAILRNVPKTFTFEEQRIEINEIALDLYNLKLGTLELTDFSVVKPNPAASGGGDVTYDNTTGEFTYTPPLFTVYSVEALLSPGIQLLDDGNAQASNRIFFDGLNGLSIARKSGTTNTIEFSGNSDWNNAHSWGDHKLEGYLKSNGTYWDTNTNAYESSTLDLIGNVTLTNIQADHYLKWNGTAWVNTSITIPAAQVQVDWDQTDINHIEYIKNKPTNVSDFTNDAGYVTVSGDDNVQSNWTEGNANDDAYIKNKPTIPTNNNQLTNGAGYITSYQNDNTTYTLDSSTENVNDVKLTLLGNDSSTDSVVITKGNNITFSNVTTGGFTISATGGGGSGSVTSITPGTGITSTPNPITSTGTISLNASIGQLTNVDASGANAPSDGQVLKWNQSAGAWRPATDLTASGGGVTDLIDLNDVSYTGIDPQVENPPTNSVLQWNGSHWTNAILDWPEYLAELTDVSNTPPNDGEVLAWDDSNSIWIPTALSGGGTDNYVDTATLTGTDLVLGRTGSLADLTVNLSSLGGGGLQNVVEDTTPQLGGNLDVQTREINTSTTNGNIKLTPNGTGVVEVKGAGGNDGTIQLNCSQNSHGVKIKSPPHSAGASYTLTLPNDDGSSGDYLKSDGSGNLSWDTPSSANTLDEVLTAGNTSSNWFSVGGVNTDGTSSSSVFRQKVHIRDVNLSGDRISLNPANGHGISTHDGLGLNIANISTNIWRWSVDGSTGDMYVRYGGIKDKDGDLGSPGQILSSTGTQINWIDSGTAANVTTSDTAPTSPSNGDLWWDSTSGNLKIRYEDGDSNQWVDATSTLGAAGSSGANVTISLTAPTTPNSGDLWWKSDEGQLKIFYDDTQGTPSTQWVDAVNITSDDTSNTLTSHFGQQSFPRFTFDKLTPFANTIPGNQRYGVYRSANKTNRTGADLSTIFDGDNTTFVKITDHETNLFASNGSSQGTFMLVFDTPITDIEEIRLGMDGWGSPGYTGVGVSGAIWNGGTNAGKQSEEGSLLGRIDAPYAGLTGSAQEVIIFEGSPMTLTYLMFTAWDDPNTQNPASHGNWSAGTASDFITNLYYIKIRKTGGELVELTYDINQDPSALDEYVLDQWTIIHDGVTITPAPPAPLSTAGGGRGVERVGFPFELVGGKGMAVDSNGIWTFPSPGVWKLDLNVPYYSTTTSSEMNIYLEYTDDDSSWKWISRSEGHLTANQELYLRIQYTLNIKDITKQKIKIYTGGISGSSFYHPSGGGNMVSGFSAPYHVHRGGLTFEKVQRVNSTY